MNTPRFSVIDDIIKNWFPIMGILFVVAGMSYLFYEGIWQTLNETGRLTLGFFSGIALISGSYAIKNTSKIIADSVLGGGLLMLYISLIFGSRFEATEQQGLIPEAWALLIATFFTIGVAFFSYTRRSHYVLLIGIFGGYLTPFFMGEGDQFVKFIMDEGVFRYHLPLMAFLIYFFAINIAILIVANQFFLKGIGLLNTLGLFAGTTSLSYFMGGQFPDNVVNLAVFSLAVLGLNIAAMCVNSKKFEKELDPYLIAGYLLPLVWFTAMLNVFIEPYLMRPAVVGLLLGATVVYFGGWHYLRKTINLQKHTALYLGGVLSLFMAVIKMQSYLQHYDGLIMALIGLIFGVLYFLNPVLQREMAFFFFTCFGVLMTLWHMDNIALPSLWFLNGKTIALSLAVSPFILGVKFPERMEEGEFLKTFRQLGFYLAIGVIVILVFIDLIQMEGIPLSFLFFTLPAVITGYVSYKDMSGATRIMLIKLSLFLAAAGFVSSLFTIIGRFSPFPSDIHPFTTAESFMGVATLVLILLLKNNLKRMFRANQEKAGLAFGPAWQFFMVFSLYSVLWATATHEIMAFFNFLDIDLQSEGIGGIRSFAITIWWALLAGWMIFLGVADSTRENEKNIGFGLFALTIFKILFIDLHDINTNLKIFIFLIVGCIMLAISFFANKRFPESE